MDETCFGVQQGYLKRTDFDDVEETKKFYRMVETSAGRNALLSLAGQCGQECVGCPLLNVEDYIET